MVLSIQVRRASISFKETKLITWAILNECIVICFEITVKYVDAPHKYLSRCSSIHFLIALNRNCNRVQ